MLKEKTRPSAFECCKANPLKALWVIFMGLILIMGPGALGAVRASTANTVKEADRKAIIQKVVKLQMPFIANQGQIADKHVRFYARTFGGNVHVTNDGEMVYSFPLLESKSKAADGASKPREIKACTLKEKLIGASSISPRGVDQAQTKVNYFMGSEKNRWKTNIPTYNTVSLGKVYKGINLSLEAYGRNVEKVFTVMPGADPKAIRVRIEGANSLSINDKGALELETRLGLLRFSSPLAYQEKNGKRENVQMVYHLDKDTYGFTILFEMDGVN